MSFTLTISSISRRSAAAIFTNHSKKFGLKTTNSGTLFKTFSTMASGTDHYTVAITGSSGLLGTALIDELSKKAEGKVNGKPLRIIKLVRSESVMKDEGPVNEMITSQSWNPKAEDSGAIDKDLLESIDSLVHLAGENVGSGLLPGPLGWLGIQAWSKEKKDLIMKSRVGPTKALAHDISQSASPTSFIVASGVGVYGNDFMEDKDDRTAPDESFDISQTTGFLADVSREWEEASMPAGVGKNRVVNLRLAPVLSKLGGALGKLYPIFFLGGGGNVGSGNQFFSYISARDAARAIVHVIETPTLSGPVNLVAPKPATNAQFTSSLGKILSRPTIIPLPSFAVKLLFGEMGEEMLLGGVKASPKKLFESGFEFQHETIDDALKSALNESI